MFLVITQTIPSYNNKIVYVYIPSYNNQHPQLQRLCKKCGIPSYNNLWK